MKIGKWNVTRISGGWGQSIRVSASPPAQVREFDVATLEPMADGIGVIDSNTAAEMAAAAKTFQERL